MDPNVTWNDFLTALADADPEVASHRLDDLAAWLDRGGFIPSRLTARDLSPTELSRLLVSAAAVLAWAATELNPEPEGETP